MSFCHLDFDSASKMKEDNRRRTIEFASLRHHRKSRRVPMDDWESYLYTLSDLLSIPLDWFRKEVTDATKNDKKARFELYGKLKANRTKILVSIHINLFIHSTQNELDLCLQETIQQQLQIDDILKNVLLEFAREVFSDKQIPDYDRFYKMVTDTLPRYFDGNTCFSWITKKMADRTIASNYSNRKRIKESIKRANTEIGDLVIPTDFSEYERFVYVDADEEFFNKPSKQSNWFFACTKSPCAQ